MTGYEYHESHTLMQRSLVEQNAVDFNNERVSLTSMTIYMKRTRTEAPQLLHNARPERLSATLRVTISA
jgi:hypothetical protein